MEARLLRAALTAALLFVAMGAGARTPNFVVQTADPQLATQFAQAAEKYRHDLAIEWLGEAMPDWSQPCTVTVQVGPNLGAGGATTFLFDRGEVYGWRMNIQGSAERVLDSVLPHEITHMIFASYFRRPVPRWADEGGATSAECPSEKAKHKRMLVQFLQTGRGIAFNQMFAMSDYPPDVMPLYAQGHSLAEYLIQQGGRRKFVAYVAEGMQTGQWAEATQRHYGVQDLGTLQNQWVAWVGQGSPALAPKQPPTQPAAPAKTTLVADSSRQPRPEPNLIYRINRTSAPETTTTAAADSPSPAPVRAHVTRPQPIEKPQQVILEWGRN